MLLRQTNYYFYTINIEQIREQTDADEKESKRVARTAAEGSCVVRSRSLTVNQREMPAT